MHIAITEPVCCSALFGLFFFIFSFTKAGPWLVMSEGVRLGLIDEKENEVRSEQRNFA